MPGPKVNMQSPEGDLKREAVRRESDREEKEKAVAQAKKDKEMMAYYKAEVRRLSSAPRHALVPSH